MSLHPQLFTIFLGEIHRQCRFALYALGEYNDAMPSNPDRVFWALQSLFTASGNISKLLWPPQSSALRGDQLRDALDIPSSSPLKARKMRNHLEHFDERLETWWGPNGRHHFIDSNIGPARGIGGIDTKDYLRNLEEPLKMTFQGEEYDIIPILSAIGKLKTDVEALEQWLRNP